MRLTAGTGGGTAFSVAESVGFVQVRPVNGPPVPDVGGEPPLTRVLPTATDPAGDRGNDLLGSSATDVEWDSLGIAVTAATGKGTWEFQLDGATGWTPVGKVSTKAPRLLHSTDRIRFVPDAGFLGGVKLSFKAWDAGSVNPTDSLALRSSTETAVGVVHTAPVLHL